jgi:hypothetical protein
MGGSIKSHVKAFAGNCAFLNKTANLQLPGFFTAALIISSHYFDACNEHNNSSGCSRALT